MLKTWLSESIAKHRKRNGEIESEKLLKCTSAFKSSGLCQYPWGMEVSTNQECTMQCQESLEIRLDLSSRLPRRCPGLGPQGSRYIPNRNIPAGISDSQGAPKQQAGRPICVQASLVSEDPGSRQQAPHSLLYQRNCIIETKHHQVLEPGVHHVPGRIQKAVLLGVAHFAHTQSNGGLFI